MKILIKDGIIVTMNPARDIIRGDILVDEDRIMGIGQYSDTRADMVLDARDKLVIPGLIQSHVHLCQALFRGLADDLELLDWLRFRIWPLEGSHDQESMYYSALTGLAEMIRGGTTGIIDMASVHHTSSVFMAVKESGIRYLGGKCLMNRGDGVPPSLLDSTGHALQESADLLEQWNGREHDRIRYAFCPRFAISCSDELLRQVAALAAKYRVPVHTHASESRAEIALVEEERGLSNVLYLDELGLCGHNLILAHCIHLQPREMQVLVDSGTNIAHCPGSNLKLGSGIAQIPELLDMGAQVSLGADGAPCNNNLSLFMEMRLAALIQKPRCGPRSMPAEKVFELATLGGARAMGLENETGSLETGKKADIAIVDLQGWHHAPVEGAGVYGHLVYQAQASDVWATLIDGRPLMLDGRLLTIEEEAVRREAGHALIRVCRRAGLDSLIPSS